MNTEIQPTQSQEGPNAILAIKDKAKRLQKIKNCIDESILTQLAKKATDAADKKAIIANEFTPYDVAVKLGTKDSSMYPSLQKKIKSKDPLKAKPKEQRRIAAYSCTILKEGSPLVYMALVKDICGPLFHAPRSVRAKQLASNTYRTTSPLLFYLTKDFKENVTENELLKNITPPIITKLNKALVKAGIITAEQAGKAAKITLNHMKENIKKGIELESDLFDFQVKQINEISEKARGVMKGTVKKIQESSKALFRKEKSIVKRGYNYLKNLLEL